MEEVWVNIKDFPDYQISNFGRVKSVRQLKSGKVIELLLKPLKINNYHIVVLYKNKQRFYKSIHRLVLETFNPINNSDDLECNHMDGNKINNLLENLEWSTRSENMKHAYKIGLEVCPKGILNHSHKKTENEIIEIKNLILNGTPIKNISKDFNISISNIYNIKTGKRWSHIKIENEKELTNIKYGERHHSAKLKKYEVKIIKKLINQNISVELISTRFNVSKSTIMDIKFKRTWKNVEEDQ